MAVTSTANTLCVSPGDAGASPNLHPRGADSGLVHFHSYPAQLQHACLCICYCTVELT